MTSLNITIAGAGSIGCFVGGALAHHGHTVRFLARRRVVDGVAKAGALRLSDYAGMDISVPVPEFSVEPSVLASADLILVTVKSSATAQMGQLIAEHAKRDAVIISLQNGVGNAATLRAALPAHDVRAGMVPFNVVGSDVATYHRATSGDIEVGAGTLANLNTDYLVWKSVDNIEAVQWGKLLINLGNALNALSGLTLYEQLQDRAWRRLIAAQMSEALGILKANAIVPAKTTAAPPGAIPFILRLPTPLFKKVAAQMLTIDPTARSSMWDDLMKRRITEIDALQGVIVDLAKASGRSAPLNAKVSGLIKQAETANNGPPGLTVQDIINP
jgi:2-dehydropantoate 2-reductase